MDPSLKAVQDHSVAVVMDTVNRYDIDGVHFDDYFYPYQSYNNNEDFPDDKSWAAYRADGGKLARADWRREAVNRFIRRIHDEVKAAKPHVKFGISPFGIWRPGHPPGIQGLDQYNALYADAKRWLNEGWVDYLTPQLYWPIAQVPQSFPVLLGWWSQENTKQRHLWPGTTLSRVRRPGGELEILNQIMITRGSNPESPGLCMFSMKTLMSERSELAEQLTSGPYAAQALIPASTWLDNQPPAAPKVEVERAGSAVKVSWSPGSAEGVFLWVICIEQDGQWTHRIVPGSLRGTVLADADKAVTKVAVSAIDRVQNESKPTAVKVE